MRTHALSPFLLAPVIQEKEQAKKRGLRQDLFVNAYRGFILHVPDLETTQWHWLVDRRARCDVATQRSLTPGSQGAQNSRASRVGRTPPTPIESSGRRGPRRPTLLLCSVCGCSRLRWAIRQRQARAGRCPPLGEPGSPTPNRPWAFQICRGSAQLPSSGGH